MNDQTQLREGDSDLLKQVHDLTEQIRALEQKHAQKLEQSGEDRERADRLTEAVRDLSRQLVSRQEARKSEFPAVDVDRVRYETGGRGREWLDTLHREPTHDSDLKAFQKAADNAYIVHALLSCKGPVDPRGLDVTRRLRAAMQIPQIKADAVDVADIGTPGDGWYPVGFSASLNEDVRLARRVAALHDRVQMPSDPFKLPIEGDDANVYVVAERTGSEDYVTAANLIKATTPVNMTNLTLQTKKVGSRLVTSAEADEASIIALLPYFRRKIVNAMRDAEEDATINGDTDVGTTAASDLDMQSAASDHHRSGWNGYRELIADNSLPAIDANLTLDLSDLRTVRANMGKYAVTTGDVVWVTGAVGYNKIVALPETTTVDKYGPRATVITGEVARIDGIPIVLSEFVREDLNASGVHDASTTDRTQIFLVNRSQFLYGDFRAMSLNSRYVPDTDQNVIVVLQRLIFSAWRPTKTTVGHVYNIKK